MSQIFNPEFKSIGESFVQHYYTCYDNGRKPELASLYHDTALLTFEGDQKQGKVEIMTKHMAVTCATSHAITRTDCQPTSDGGVLVVVLGQLKTDGEDKPLGFNHIFVLKPDAQSFFIFHEIFQLALHNF